MLMDQGPSRKHLGDAFKPDPNSSSFRRPAAEMNIASGCPLFVSQSVLETGSYIKDDTIFIKVGQLVFLFLQSAGVRHFKQGRKPSNWPVVG